MSSVCSRIHVLAGIIIFALPTIVYGQSTKQERQAFDSAYIEFVEDEQSPDKVLHAEPLYIDLIRDLGARKGEREWNVGLGLTDNLDFDSYDFLVEYEFAPINRLGVEFELPFTFYSAQAGTPKDSLPGDHLDAIKLATQWSFFVSEEMATSMALGYIHEFLTNDFDKMKDEFFIGQLYNPFFVIAKRWGTNFHSLIYTGPMFKKYSASDSWINSYDLNANIHYMVSSTRNFIGIEFNMTFQQKDFDMTIRPQMRLDISEYLLIGILAGIPVEREEERFSAFVRLIWEPIR